MTDKCENERTSQMVDLTAENNHETGCEFNSNHDGGQDVCMELSNSNVNRVSYTELNNIASELCRTVSNDQQQCKETFVYLKQWIEHLRKGKSIEVKFVSTEQVTNFNAHSSIHITPKTANGSDESHILPATLGTTNAMRLGKRFIGGIEHMSNQNTNHSKSYTRTSAVTRERKSTLFSAHNTNNDEAYLTPERSRKKYNTCGLCNQPHCAQWSCKKLKEYGGTIIVKNSKLAREKVGSRIMLPQSGIVEERENSDNRSVLLTIPKKGVKALVIHRKLVINKNVMMTLDFDNVAIEVTLLGDGGYPKSNYEKVLFTPSAVNTWVTFSQNRLFTSLI